MKTIRCENIEEFRRWHELALKSPAPMEVRIEAWENGRRILVAEVHKA